MTKENNSKGILFFLLKCDKIKKRTTDREKSILLTIFVNLILSWQVKQ
jgi:hypothetical protein